MIFVVVGHFFVFGIVIGKVQMFAALAVVELVDQEVRHERGLGA